MLMIHSTVEVDKLVYSQWYLSIWFTVHFAWNQADPWETCLSLHLLPFQIWLL